jgi:putative integral membrane protein (TIGR02587 family)
LFLIGFISPTDGLHAIIGRIVMEGLPFSLGVGLADVMLGEKGDGAHDKGRQEGKAKGGADEKAGNRILVRAGASAFGATVVALALSATQEIPLLASHVTYPRLLGIVGASLILSYLIVFASNFVATEAREAHGGFDAPLAETVMSYVISLAMAAGMLWLFQLLHIGDPLNQWVGETIVLGLPASIGGAAGRLAA